MIAIIIFFFFFQFSFASDISPSDRKLLTDLPVLNSENLRWMVPADGWTFKNQHTAKGKFFKISIEGSILNSELLIYKTPSFSTTPTIKISGDQIWSDGKWKCESSSYKRSSEDAKQVLGCRDASCSILDSQHSLSSYKQNIFSDSKFLRSKEGYVEDCSTRIDFYVKNYPLRDNNADSIYDFLPIGQNTDWGRNYYFRFSGIAKDNSHLVIPVNGADHYLDIRFCKNDPSKCSVVDIEFSDFEKDWVRLKKLQLNKDLLYLNLLISKLRPCVEKKDFECIQKFFPDKDEHDYLLEWRNGYQIPGLILNDELINELSACLDYKSLLPHLYGLRGVNKVCIFQKRVDLFSNSKSLKNKPGRQDLMLLNVTYPEAVRIRHGYPIYLNLSDIQE